MEEGVGFGYMWLNCAGRYECFTRDAFHLTGKGAAAVCGCAFVRVVGYRELFKLDAQGELTEKTQRSANTYPKECSPIISGNARNIVNKKVS